MERCPNCGATVRPGAKFCTTCGMRLPEAPAVESNASTNRSPFESTSSISGSRWPAEKPGQEAATGAASGYAVGGAGDQPANADEPAAAGEVDAAAESPTSTETEPVADAAAETPSVWPPLGRTSTWDDSWRSSAESTESAESAESAAPETVSEAAEEPAAEAAAAPEAAADDVAPTPDTEMAEEAETELEMVGAEPAADEAVAAVEPVAEEEEVAVVSETVVDSETEAEALVETAEPAEPVELEESVALEEPDVPEETEVPEQQPAPAAIAVGAETTGGVDRAYALLDELRSLLPGLAGGAASQVDISAVADELATARSDDEAGEFTALRRAIDSARERPRDIDTMLDVSGRLDAITALHDAYERLAATVDTAVAKLRAPAGEGAQEGSVE